MRKRINAVFALASAGGKLVYDSHFAAPICYGCPGSDIMHCQPIGNRRLWLLGIAEPAFAPRSFFPNYVANPPYTPPGLASTAFPDFF